jgi:hypothetical protein
MCPARPQAIDLENKIKDNSVSSEQHFDHGSPKLNTIDVIM